MMNEPDIDLTPTIEPNSDQIGADDLLAGPRTVTIHNVTKGSSEQPVNVELAEFPGRPWRPSKSMRRVLVAAWGSHSSSYIGRRVTLFRNPDITFGREKVGGIQVSHMSGIDKPLTVPLTVKRGRKTAFTVQPLPDSPQPPSPQQIAACTDVEQLKAWWHISDPQTRQLINARAAEMTTPTPAPDPQTGEIPMDDGPAFEQQSTPPTGPDPWADQTQES